VPRILVADDNSNIQKMVTLALEERGVDVVAVGNGEAAVRRLADVNPDLVLADVFMPVRNGYEVCEYVKKDTRFAHIPVILLVGAFDPLDEKEARRVGADGVLKKPFVPPDPLIAMVMQVLEKNPRVAAELAKQKEVIAAPPPPPMEALETPARSEPKPLPDFPEPTPEEAAQIYGFGKGVRALAGDDDEEEEDKKYSKKSKNSKTAKAPVASAAETDEYEEVATASDWRRNAADFDVPENVAQDAIEPIEPVEDKFDSSAFPSEKDVPPKRVRNAEFSDEQESPENHGANVQDSFPSSHSLEVPVLSVEPADAVFEKISPAEDMPQTSHAMWLSEPKPEPAVTAATPSFEAKETVREEPREEAREEVREQPKVIAQPEPSPAPASRATEWMDMMAPPPSEYPDGGWMSNMTAPSTPAAATHVEAETKPAESHAEVSPENHGNGNAPVAQAEETLHQEAERTEDYEFSSRSESNERFFADAPGPAKFSYHFPPDESRETARSHEEPAAAPVASSAPEPSNELVSAPADAEHHDDDASSQPAPEPLLVDEEHSEPSLYLPSPEPAQHILPASVEQQNRQPDALLEHLEQSVFEPAAQTSAVDEFSERIPTLPPPNREALAGIPFLMPPPASALHESLAAEPEANDAHAIDEVVRKVLEKLQPHLQELFSQGVKPLVENLVHSELSKKDR
jgi:CheY-like chemotaxis protein